MPSEKILHFKDKHIDLTSLTDKISEYLKSDGFTVQSSPTSSQGTVLQAKKGKFLAGVIDADRAMTIYISGTPDDFTVRIGIGKWLEHLGVAMVETLLISELFFVVDIAEMAWNLEIENKLVKEISSIVG